MNRPCKILNLFLAALLILSGAAPAVAERAPLPELLMIRQHSETTYSNAAKIKTYRTYPDTANEAVNREISAAVDRLFAGAQAHMPKRASLTGLADAGATVRVSGTKTASFFVYGHADAEREQLWCDFETFVFDLETGKQLTLDDVFDASADELLRGEVRSQLSAYFPSVKADEAALEGFCESIRQTPFTLSPAYLSLHYHASALYPGRTTLMHVKVPYRLLTEHMTDYGRAELDNSDYLLAALTFDDGPGRGVTASILQVLREYSAVGTFFNLGRPMRSTHDYVAWEHDAGHAVQSHTYSHTDRLTDFSVMEKERERFAREQIEIIGIPPSYMRAPGGNDKLYAKYGIGMPIVRWTTLSGDAVDMETGKRLDFGARMIHTLKQTSVILMHNINFNSVRAASEILDRLYERSYMFVTVDELFEIRGMPMQDNIVYFGDEADQQE